MLLNSDEYNENGIKDSFFDLEGWMDNTMIDEDQEGE